MVHASENKNKAETIQDIAFKLVEEQLKVAHIEGTKEQTIFVLGNKQVGKTTAINKFFDREEATRPTLALDYSYGRRTNHSHESGKQILNIWELGSLDNGGELMEVPLLTHGITHFSGLIMLDLSQTHLLWRDIESALVSLRNAAKKVFSNFADKKQEQLLYDKIKELNKIPCGPKSAEFDLMPFPVIIIGGKYDLFMDFDPEVKKHICRCLRSVAHLIGGSLLFHSNKIPKLSKSLRDAISHLGFGSPTNPFRAFTTDYNEALSIWFGCDSWDRIGVNTVPDLRMIGATLSLMIPQSNPNTTKEQKSKLNDPAKDPGFGEDIIDEIRSQKYEELEVVAREHQLRSKFESVSY